MTLDTLINQLAIRLKEELPGKNAHESMMATAVTGKRLNFRPRGEPKMGAVLILFFERADQLYFVLTQRPDYEGTHGGQVSFPGGRREESDFDLVETALRETEEEIGVNKNLITVVGKLSEYYVAASNHLVLPVVGYMKDVPVYKPDAYEVAEVFSVPLFDLLNPEKVKITELTVGKDQFKLRAPYFDFHNKVVWGATAGMLSELKAILSNG